MKYLRISRHGKVRGGVMDDEEDEFKLSPSADEDEFDTDDLAAAARGPRTPAAAAAVPGTLETKWRFGGARRKRLSLPTIRLYSSLDSPGACYGDQPPQPGTVTQVICISF